MGGHLFSGFCAIVFSLELISPQLAFVEFTRAGFRMGHPLRWNQAVTPWREIATIETYRWYTRVFPHIGIRIRYVLHSRRNTSIPSTRIFGCGAAELAALMNRFRDRALRSGET
jgi:hypothetical protein